MQENTDNTHDTDAAVSTKGFLSWLDNFWYHYKWHSIIALFVIFAIVICSVQMCQKESHDMYMLYAGGYEIERTSTSGDVPYAVTRSSLTRAASDYDEDGKVSVSLRDLFMLTADEIKEIENSDQNLEVNYYLINENKQVLRDTIMYSNYYVCFLSTSVYDEYKTIDGVDIFASLTPFVNEDVDVAYYSDSAIYLSSTPFSYLPGICDLPDDTVICLRKASVFASHFNKAETERDYKRGEEAISKIINYGK